jgi:hypothetical protein
MIESHAPEWHFDSHALQCRFEPCASLSNGLIQRRTFIEFVARQNTGPAMEGACAIASQGWAAKMQTR